MEQFEAIVQRLEKENHNLRTHCNAILHQQQSRFEYLESQIKHIKHSNTG